jgi:hypothetical protein
MRNARRYPRCLIATVAMVAVLVGFSVGDRRWFRCAMNSQSWASCCCGADAGGEAKGDQVPDQAPHDSWADHVATLVAPGCCDIFTATAADQSRAETAVSFRLAFTPSAVLPVAWAVLAPCVAADRPGIVAAGIEGAAVPLLLRKQSFLI